MLTTSTTTAPKQDGRRQEVNKFMLLMEKIGIYAVVIILLIVGTFVAPGKFFAIKNFLSIIQAVSLLGIVAAGLSFIVYSSNYNDMSVPMNIAFSGMVAVTLLKYGIIASLLGGIATGVVMGAVNGLMVGRFRAHPILWTMAINFVWSGIVRWMYSGNQIYPDVVAGSNKAAAEAFYAISRSDFLGIPISVLVMILMLAIGQFILKGTRFGNQLKVIGINYETARLSGINVQRNIFLAYIITGFCAAICGIFLASVAKTGAYYNGEGYDFQGVTAVLLGGMTLSGGKGNLIGVFGGVLTVGMLSNIMTLIGVTTFQQYMAQGLMFLLIVWLSTNSSRKLGRG